MKNFTSGHIGRQIIFFALPIILGNFFMQLYQIVDSIIVGQYLGKEALAAVGASTPIVFAVVALVIGIGSGASVVISQYFGGKEREKVNLTSDTLHIFLLGAGFVVAIIGIFCSELIFSWINLPEALIPQASTYLKIYLGGAFLMFGFNTIASILRGVGDSKTPLYFLLISALLNVGLDYLFIVGFGWGIAGAAWATVIAQGVAYFAAILYINRTSTIFYINLLKLKFDRKIFRQCVNYGLPTGIQQSFVAYGAVALMSIVNGFGTDVIAGYAAGLRIDGLAVIPAMNFSMALTSFVGQNVGAGRYDRVAKGLRLTLLYSSITCIVISAIIIIFGTNILHMFTTDAAVVKVGVEYLVVVSSFYLVFNAMFIINGTLRGAGAVIAPMVITIVALWGVRVPLSIWLSGIMGESGIWWSIPIGWAIGMTAAFIYYKTGNWKNKSIIKR
ncbi:MAG: MATE family efflux transporter [Mucinivorans sp.]